MITMCVFKILKTKLIWIHWKGKYDSEAFFLSYCLVYFSEMSDAPSWSSFLLGLVSPLLRCFKSNPRLPGWPRCPSRPHLWIPGNSAEFFPEHLPCLCLHHNPHPKPLHGLVVLRYLTPASKSYPLNETPTMGNSERADWAGGQQWCSKTEENLERGLHPSWLPGFYEITT